MNKFCCLMLAGCATVEHETLLSHARQPERCDGAELVASAYPGEWPNVTIEVDAQRTCSTEIADTYDVESELHVSKELATGIAAGVGAVVGAGIEVLLIGLAENDRRFVYSYTTNTRGDELLLLPLVGAVAFGSIVQGRQTTAVQSLGHSVRVATHHDVRQDEGAAIDGELMNADATLGRLVGGHVSVPLEVATKAYGRSLWLGAQRVDWSVRRNAWVPGLLPSCARAARVWQARGFEALSAEQVQRASDDAEACAADGWPFAHSMVSQLAQMCRDRFKSSCAYAR